MRTPSGKRLRHRKKRVKMGKTLRFRERDGEDLASSSLWKLDKTVANTLATGYLSLPSLVANVNEEWMADNRSDHLLCPDDTFDRCDSFLLFVQTTIMPGENIPISCQRRTLCCSFVKGSKFLILCRFKMSQILQLEVALPCGKFEGSAYQRYWWS